MPPAELEGGVTWVARATEIVPETTAAGAVRFHFWPATARTMITDNPQYSAAKRTKSKTFMVGLKEEVHFETQTGAPWEWRQIVFSIKGFHNLPWVDSYVAYNGNTSGYMRGQREMDSGAQGILTELIFKGAEGVDFVGYMNAPLDRSRIHVMRDRTRQIRSGNEIGTLRKYDDWLPMRKTLTYNDDEQGSEFLSRRWASMAKGGMGDVYVVDMFRTIVTSDPNDLLSWRNNSTLYWHER